MSASGYTPILIYASGTTGNTPSASNLTSGSTGAELAINYYDGKLFYKDNSGTVQVLATKASASNTFSAGTTGFTPSTATTGAVTLAGTLATTNGGTGLTSFTANGVVYASSTSALTTGSALVFDGNKLVTNALSFNYYTGAYTLDGTISNYASSNSLYVNGNAGGYLILQGSGNQKQQIGINGSNSGGEIFFQTNGLERARFDSSGNLLVGTTSTLGAGVVLSPSASTPLVGVTGSASSGGSTYTLYSTGASAYRFYVDFGGTIHATSTVISAISDQRLKENVRDIDTGLSSIMALKPRRFDWKEGKGQDKKNAAGFIAQEFEEVFPECVSTSKAGGDGIEYKNINHETLIPTLVKAIQEQQALIESLTKRLADAGIA